MKRFSYGIYWGVLLLIFLLYEVAFLFKKTEDEPVPTQFRDLDWRDINFIHTTDTHGWYSGHFNREQYNASWGDFVSFTTHLKRIARLKDQDLLVIDSGDRHDGNGLSDATTPNGLLSLPIFNRVGYDLLTVGNHELYEWENTEMELEVVIDRFKNNYVSTNVEYLDSEGNFKPLGQRYKYFVTPRKNLKVLTLSFLFDFRRNNNGTRVLPIQDVIEKEWFKQILVQHPPQEVDLLIVNGHLPVSHEWTELEVLHKRLRTYYPSTKIQYFGGHSHIRDFSVFDASLTGLQSGRFCETVGWASISFNETTELASDISKAKRVFSRSYIDFNVQSFMHHSGADSFDAFETREGLQVKDQIAEARKELGLDNVIGYVKNSNYYLDYVPITNDKSLFKLLSDKVLPTLTLSERALQRSDERIIIINTGSIRYDIYMGPYTLDSEFIVSPFKNKWVRLTVPKRIAVKVADKLNQGGYIANSQETKDEIDNNKLLPPHQYFNLLKQSHLGKSGLSRGQDLFVNSLSGQFDTINDIMVERRSRLTKGYVTHDDFGHDGDDTLHKPVFNHPLPNVVLSEQLLLATSDDSPVDLIFYDFIKPNILWALSELEPGSNYSKKVESYSDQYLKQLLSEYIKNHDI